MENRQDPAKQFSKKLARWTSVFWFAYMTWLSVLFMLSRDTALYCVYMGLIVTAVMILNVWAYTKNSTYEKGLNAMLDKMRIELSLNGTHTETQDADDGDGGEVSNG